MILLYEFLYVKHPKLKIHDCRFYNDTFKIENTRVPVMVRFSTLIQSTSSPDINIFFVSCVHFQNHSAKFICLSENASLRRQNMY